MMQFHRYVVRMRHDSGVVNIHVTARNKTAAAKMVLAAERNAPPSAIVGVRREKSKTSRRRKHRS